MTRQQDGTYRINHIINFPSKTDQFVDTSISWKTYSLSEEGFLERINANPQPPLFMDSEFPPGPLFSPVLIRTENNSLYLFPIDARTSDDIVFIAEDIQQTQIIDTFIGITTSKYQLELTDNQSDCRILVLILREVNEVIEFLASLHTYDQESTTKTVWKWIRLC